MKKPKSVYFLLICMFILLISAMTFLPSGVYKWDETNVARNSTGWTKEMIKSPTRSLGMFTIEACSVMPGKSLAAYNVESGTDEMYIIKDGNAVLNIGNKTEQLTAGSVAVIPQGEKVQVKNDSKGNLIYHIFRFKTGRKPAGRITPFISLWDTVRFTPSANGGRRNIINQETSALKNLEIHVTTLKEGLPSHAAHTHTDEEIILMRKGTSEMSISGVDHSAGTGSAIFLSNDDPHGIRNSGKGDCEYYAIRWITDNEVQKK